ncbi:MAG: chitobiase/beta-hexosaminidase C-terminal domain-containing protein [Saprospiraceae bacterium]
MAIIEFFGRLHPLILHLPIGVLFVAFAMAWLSRKESYQNLQPAVGFALQLGAATCVLAAVSGYVLSNEGGYDEELLNYHKWLGIATAVGAIGVYVLHLNRESWGQKIYFPAFAGVLALIGGAGHFGGSLTHGSEFLMEPFQPKAEERAAITNIDSAYVFADLVQPILQQKCVSCHNESKIKGELLLTTIEGIKKGGEKGKFFVAGNTSQSRFLQRVHLPATDKLHMPPKGKQQLTQDEIRLLEWWVAQGADFKKQVAEVEQTEEVRAVLTKFTAADNSVLALDIEPASTSALAALQQAGAKIDVILEEKPFITVQLRGKQDLDKKVMQALAEVGEQTVALDLSQTNLTDDLLSYLADFPHLQKLFLQKTAITGGSLDALKDLKYLEYLNLYGTPLTDAAVPLLSELTSLRNLFLWETNVSAASIQQLKTARPDLTINTGIDPEVFGKAKLKPPLIVLGKEIFTDSTTVEFDLNINGIEIFYTLDGTPPDSTSTKYTGKFYVTESANIQVIASKTGWEASEPAQQGAVRARYAAQSAKLNKPPHERYKAEGGKSLIDFTKGTINFTDSEWLGYEGEHFTATLDMGETVSVSNVSVSALEATGSYIFFPKQVNISVSKDGKSFTSVVKEVIPTTAGPEPPLLKQFVLPFEEQKARYVRVEVKSNLKNPKWHQAPGANCWVFVDEILVD